jgi:hypothetical protein
MKKRGIDDMADDSAALDELPSTLWGEFPAGAPRQAHHSVPESSSSLPRETRGSSVCDASAAAMNAHPPPEYFAVPPLSWGPPDEAQMESMRSCCGGTTAAATAVAAGGSATEPHTAPVQGAAMPHTALNMVPRSVLRGKPSRTACANPKLSAAAARPSHDGVFF